MSERVRTRNFRWVMRLAILAGLLAIATSAAAPSSASAACPEPSAPTTFSTSWGGGSGHYNTDANWTNGVPTALCDASITAAGTYTVTMNGGSNAKSMTIGGGAGSNPTLEIRAEGPNTNLAVVAGGFLNIASGASLTLRCNPSPACGSPNVSAPAITNIGTFNVESTVNGTPFISGTFTNTGTMNFDHTAKFDNGAVINQGAVNIATATTVLSGGSSCGDTSVSFKNDTGGTLNVTGTGTFDVINYEQGAGAVSGTSTNPVQVPCGSVKFTGNGASKVKAYGGFDLTGTVQSNQSLTVSAEGAPNVNAILKGNFTNNGSITLTSSLACGPTCGAGFNVNDKDFVNDGTFTIDAASGTGAGVGANFEGSITNTGTMNFDQTAYLGGPVTNQGAINIADTKMVTNSGSSCGDAGGSVKNDTGGSINATGTGTFNISTNYEQGNGTTSGENPVQMPCGSLKYTGTGSGISKVLAYGGFGLSGEMQSNQSLTVTNASSNTNMILNSPFTSKGSITFTCPTTGCNGPGLNATGNAFTNAGTFTTTAAASGGSTISGNVTNTGTMQLNGNATFNNGTVTNQGAINIANGVTATSTASSCGDLNTVVKNDTGGSINATGTGTFNFFTTYEQGNGTTSGENPVQMGCGNLKYTGNGANGASSVLAYGGFFLSGEMQVGQSLTVTNVSANTNLILNSPFTSKGSITFTCPSSPCGGPGFNGNGKTFTNAGTFTVDVAASNGTTLDMSSGGMTNAPAGTFQLNGNTNFNGGGPLSNEGTLQIMAGANTPGFTNSGTIVLDQSASNPFLNTGTLTNTGTITTSGASANTSSINGTVDQMGVSAQVAVPTGTKLNLNNPLLLKAGKLSGGGTIQGASGSVNNSGGTITPGASAGTLTINGTVDQTGASAQVVVPAGTTLDVNNPVLLKAGKLSGGGTLQGSVNNSGGTVTPGASAGTLTVSDNYTQEAGGNLEIEIGGTGASQFDKLAIGGNATLGGALALKPIGSYPESSTIGDSVGFLTYGGTRTEPFASTTVSPSLSCPKQLTIAYDDGAKAANAAVSNSGAICPTPPKPPVVPPVVPPVPDTVLGAHPKGKVKTRKAKAKVKFGFSSDVAGATFECKLDKAPFAPCTSPKTYRAKRGKHTFSVRAVGPGGTDQTPASFSFKVVKAKPKRR